MTRFAIHHPFAGDKLREECGVFGITGNESASAHTALGLHALQHRGQEAAGIVSFNGGQFHVQRSLGLVADGFGDPKVIDQLKGASAIGHNRYATTGDTILRNVQPLFVETSMGGLAIAHNGNLTNSHLLRRELVKKGALFQSTLDTEVIVHLVALSSFSTLPDRLIDALKQVVGAYSLVALTDSALIGVRDPMGVRPLVLGDLQGAPVLASETCALDILGADWVRDIEPGEMVIATPEGVESLKPFDPEAERFCVFEYIYFARPDSMVEQRNVYDARKHMGRELARENRVPADIVVPVPDSGVPAALGYADEAGLPFDLGIIRNHYVGRTFIEPTDHIRHLGVKLKHNANRGQVAGKRVILIDDSIVRGTTSTKIVTMMREAGATEVHMRIASPPTTHSCFYGVDTPSRKELLAARMDVEEMRSFIGVDSLAFLSVDGLYRAAGQAGGRLTNQPQYCDACLTGDYPIPLVDRDGGHDANQLSLLHDYE